MDLTILGSATPYPRPGAPCSGYLVTHGSTTVWVDAGPGTLAELQRHTRVDELDAIWISHLHADHVSDLLTAFYALPYADLSPARLIRLYGPPGTAGRLEHFLSNAARSPIERAFEVHALHDGHEAQVDGLTLRTRAVEHGLPAFGVRIEDGTTSLSYSGDTGPCAALGWLAEGTDVLLCEADAARVPEGEPSVHLTPEQAAQAARDGGAGRLVLTHVGPFLTPERAVSRAAAEFAGPVEYAVPGRRFGATSG